MCEEKGALYDAGDSMVVIIIAVGAAAITVGITLAKKKNRKTE